MTMADGAARALFRASHPMPSAAVTAWATVLVAVAGNPAGTCVLAALAVLTGQLSVGWSNDRLDVERDRRVGHGGKPLAQGLIQPRTVDAAIGAAIVGTCVFSLLLGWRAGLLHLAAVAAAWLYNAGLKATWLSWLPYAVAFGTLPAVATLALPQHPGPAAWIVAVTALIGTAVNFTNAMQGLAGHPRSDVRGAPDRIGGHASFVLAAVLLLVSGALVTWAPHGAPDAASWTCAALTAVLVVGGLVLLWPRAADRTPFYWLIPIAAVQLLVLVITARPLY
jgi:4-hydroxybenzoate polyprenyltransferase